MPDHASTMGHRHLAMLASGSDAQRDADMRCCVCVLCVGYGVDGADGDEP